MRILRGLTPSWQSPSTARVRTNLCLDLTHCKVGWRAVVMETRCVIYRCTFFLREWRGLFSVSEVRLPSNIQGHFDFAPLLLCLQAVCPTHRHIKMDWTLWCPSAQVSTPLWPLTSQLGAYNLQLEFILRHKCQLEMLNAADVNDVMQLSGWSEAPGKKSHVWVKSQALLLKCHGSFFLIQTAAFWIFRKLQYFNLSETICLTLCLSSSTAATEDD